MSTNSAQSVETVPNPKANRPSSATTHSIRNGASKVSSMELDNDVTMMSSSVSDLKDIIDPSFINLNTSYDSSFCVAKDGQPDASSTSTSAYSVTPTAPTPTGISMSSTKGSKPNHTTASNGAKHQSEPVDSSSDLDAGLSNQMQWRKGECASLVCLSVRLLNCPR